MRLNNTTPSQDSILTECDSFGGKAAEAVEIAKDLDNQLTNQLTEAKNKIEELEQVIRETPST